MSAADPTHDYSPWSFDARTAEMWLAISWLLADLSGMSDAVGYRPRGVHRPEPALRLGRIPVETS